jgi:dihydrofolate synthase/folylpolyglutamate synthase
LPRNRPFRTFDAAFAWLAARTNYETMATQRYDARTYGLARVERLLAAVGRPDRAYDVTQVLGSKGKGSTAAALAEILRASGRRVGLFTSPHLLDPRERIRVDGRPAEDRLVRDALASLVPRVEAAARRGAPLTFFEVHTVAALLVFRAAHCDAVVLEAGMGGRLDATTAADAVCKVLTSVSLDHTQHLGRTRAAIAREKAAAARAGVPFVSGEPPASVAGRVVAAACRRAGAPLVSLGRDFKVAGVRTSLDRSTLRATTTFRIVPVSRDLPTGPFEVPMLGTHQARNAALAAVAAACARWRGGPVRQEDVRRGLARTKVRARLEALSARPLVLVDGAHNPASFGVLARTVRAIAPRRRRVFVVGMAADKDVRGSLRRLRGVATLVLATTSGQARALDPEALAREASSLGLRAKTAPDPASALRQARREAGRTGTVVVTGSLYLCGAVLGL